MLDKPDFSIRQYVVALIKRCDGDATLATERLIRNADTNAQLLSELVRIGAGQAIRTHFNDARRRVSEPEEVRVERKGHRAGTMQEREIRVAAKEERRLFWDRYSLFGQMLLRDAKAADLCESINSRKIQAEGNIKRANFEHALMTGLAKTPDATVGEFYSIDKILQLASKYNVGG